MGKTCADASIAMVPGSERSCLLKDGNIVQAAMGAAEKALSSVKPQISGDSNIKEGEHGFPKGRDLHENLACW